MARFGNLDQYLDPHLTLALKGKDGQERDYLIPLPSAELGLWCRRIAQTAGEVTAASSDEELRQAGDRAAARAKDLPVLDGDLSFDERLLGSAYPQMITDGVADPYVMFAAKTVYVWIIAGEEGAERWWRAGGRPEAPSPANRQERRALQRTGGSRTAEAGGTNAPRSTSGTTSPTSSSKSRRGRRSRGRRS